MFKKLFKKIYFRSIGFVPLTCGMQDIYGFGLIDKNVTIIVFDEDTLVPYITYCLTPNELIAIEDYVKGSDLNDLVIPDMKDFKGLKPITNKPLTNGTFEVYCTARNNYLKLMQKTENGFTLSTGHITLPKDICIKIMKEIERIVKQNDKN